MLHERRVFLLDQKQTWWKKESERFQASAKELERLSSLTGSAMLTGIGAILNRFTISFTTTLRLSFAFLAVALCGMFFGPVLAGLMGVASDILRYFLIGGGQYFPGFTLNEFLSGFLFGLFLYRKPISLPRVFFARLSVVVLINLILTPLWLSILYKNAFIVLLATRIVKNLIMLPRETAILYVVCKKAASLRPYRAI